MRVTAVALLATPAAVALHSPPLALPVTIAFLATPSTLMQRWRVAPSKHPATILPACPVTPVLRGPCGHLSIDKLRMMDEGYYCRALSRTRCRCAALPAACSACHRCTPRHTLRPHAEAARSALEASSHALKRQSNPVKNPGQLVPKLRRSRGSVCPWCDLPSVSIA
jgi:hypothetical protein